ncbi:MAG: hypothetical protein HGJ94_06750 [Desulfosarcina sp.]|nr:hypothetical protein [Desulfosarcina sp.]
MMAHASGKTGPFFKMGFMGTLSGLIISPVRWFSEAFPRTTSKEAGGMLLLSSLFYAAAGALPLSGTGALVRAAILMVNALGMTVLCAAIAWLVGAIGNGSRIRFSSIWRVFAIGTIPTLLIAWVPSSFFFTEPWKWVLVALGMIYGLGMGKGRTVWVLMITASLTAVLFLAILRLMVASPTPPAF